MAVPSPSPSKQDLRSAALAARRDYARSLSSDLRDRLEAGLVDITLARLLTMPESAVTAAYYPLKNEISPLPLLDALADRGRIAALPWFADRDARMMFRAAPAVEASPWGVLQPPADAPAAAPTLILVPLVLADRKGSRIGHGKGHYDRALAYLRESGPVRTVGIAWDVQISEKALTPDPWDIPLDAIATPTEWIDCQ